MLNEEFKHKHFILFFLFFVPNKLDLIDAHYSGTPFEKSFFKVAGTF